MLAQCLHATELDGTAVPVAGVTARDVESTGAAPGVAIRSTTFS